MRSGDANDVGFSCNVDVFVSDVGFSCNVDVFVSDCKLLVMFGDDIFEVYSDCKLLFMFNVEIVDGKCSCSVIDALVSFSGCKSLSYEKIN